MHRTLLEPEGSREAGDSCGAQPLASTDGGAQRPNPACDAPMAGPLLDKNGALA